VIGLGRDAIAARWRSVATARNIGTRRNVMKLGMWTAIGVGIGTAVGVATDHLAMGVAFGAAFGVAIGTFLSARRP
jgi:hypothetical protein